MCCEDRSFIHEFRRIRELMVAFTSIEDAINSVEMGSLAKMVASEMVSIYAARLVAEFKKQHPID